GDVVDQIFARLDYDATTLTPHWYLTDHQGTIRDIVDGTGTLEGTVSYDAFGNILSDTSARGRYGWDGREIDEEIHLEYNRARYYSPELGRWITQDPLGFGAGDSNLYRYVKNGPVSHASIREVITDSGVDSITYDAFGNITSNAASRGRYGWTGREYDAEIELQYNRARYYDASTGRWVSQDPMGFDAGDSNLYRYVYNRPTLHSDPSGKQEVREIGGTEPFKAKLSFNKFNKGQMDSLQKAFQSAADIIGHVWHVLYNDKEFKAYRTAAPNSLVARWLTANKEAKRHQYESLLWDAYIILRSPPYTFYLVFDSRQPASGRAASVSF